jgi:hypothetical protein
LFEEIFALVGQHRISRKCPDLLQLPQGWRQPFHRRS